MSSTIFIVCVPQIVKQKEKNKNTTSIMQLIKLPNPNASRCPDINRETFDRDNSLINTVTNAKLGHDPKKKNFVLICHL